MPQIHPSQFVGPKIIEIRVIGELLNIVAIDKIVSDLISIQAARVEKLELKGESLPTPDRFLRVITDIPELVVIQLTEPGGEGAPVIDKRLGRHFPGKAKNGIEIRGRRIVSSGSEAGKDNQGQETDDQNL
jgi:hypothetical protein